QWFACCHARFSRLRWMSLSGPPALACNGWSVRAPGPADGFPIGAVGGAGQISYSLCHWPDARLVPRPDRQTIQARLTREAGWRMARSGNHRRTSKEAAHRAASLHWGWRKPSAVEQLGDRRPEVAGRLDRGHARFLQRGELAFGR